MAYVCDMLPGIRGSIKELDMLDQHDMLRSRKYHTWFEYEKWIVTLMCTTSLFCYNAHTRKVVYVHSILPTGVYLKYEHDLSI